MPAKDVKAYVKRNKNDAADAEAICEAVRRPTMRFVQVKSAEQQGGLMLHRTRDLLMRQRTQVINALRAHLAELGITAAQGREGLKELLKIIASDADERLPADAHASLVVLAAELQAMQTLIGSIEKGITAQHRGNEASKRLETIPGIGVIGATAIAATVTDPTVFRSGRDFAAWIGRHARIRPVANRSSGRFRNRVIAICDAFWWSERLRSCGTRSRTLKNIPGSRNFWRDAPSRSWRWRSPIKWLVWPGRCWPRAVPIGRLRWRQRRKGTGDGRMRLRMCVHELQG
jgi:transposase